MGGDKKTLEETVERVRKEIFQRPKKNKSGDPDSTNNSLAHYVETLNNESLQATTRSDYDGRGQAKESANQLDVFRVSGAAYFGHV